MAGEVDKIIEGPRGAPDNIRSVMLGLWLAQLMSLRVTSWYRIAETPRRIERRREIKFWRTVADERWPRLSVSCV